MSNKYLISAFLLCLVLLSFAVIAFYNSTKILWNVSYDSGITLHGIKKDGGVVFQKLYVKSKKSKISIVYDTGKSYSVDRITIEDAKKILSDGFEITNNEDGISTVYGELDGLHLTFYFNDSGINETLSLNYNADYEMERGTKIYVSHNKKVPLKFPATKDAVLNYFGEPSDIVRSTALGDM